MTVILSACPPIPLPSADVLQATARRLATDGPVRDRSHFAMLARQTRVLRGLATALQDRQWRPRVPYRRRVPTGRGRSRTLARLDPLDRLVDAALAPVAAAVLDPVLSPMVHGWRRGRGCASAVRSVVRGPLPDRTVLVQADIAQLYQELPHTCLLTSAGALGGAGWAFVLSRALPPWGTTTGRGLPEGASLSPILANVALALGLDRSLAALDPAHGVLAWARYGDDLLLAVRDESAAQDIWPVLEDVLRSESLRLQHRKCRVHRGNGPWSILGETVRRGSGGGGLEVVRPCPRR